MRQHSRSCLVGPRSRLLRRRTADQRSLGQKRDLLLQTISTRSSAKPAIREELVERVRAEIAAGTYLTSEKWEMALTRLAVSLGIEQ
jgi:hypothetical protein